MSSYLAPRATLQQLLQRHTTADINNAHVQKVLQRIRSCRTAALGYHLYRCSDEQCGHTQYQYHSCRDRHCPNCGAVKKQQWIEARTRELLPVKYYHVVFTVPHELNCVMLGHRKVLFKLLFDASASTLLTFSQDDKYLGATTGIISVLHTWGQQLSFHPHIHCIVSGGGITGAGKWKEAKRNDWRFLFPVKAMSMVYKTKFLQALQRMVACGEVRLKNASTSQAFFNLLYQKEWVVYSKAPFGGPATVIEYLGRYTHKVAISNHRICSIKGEEGSVTFGYKDYKDGGKQKQMTLAGEEFIRRFSQHILPARFTKIRTYGYLANRGRHKRINEVLQTMKLPTHKQVVNVPLQIRMLEHFGTCVEQCPCCKNRTLKLVRIFSPWKQTADG